MINDIFPVLRRQWRSAVAAAAVCMLVVIAVTLALPKSYQATTTLSVNTRPVAKILNIDSTIGQDLSRSFSTLAANPNVASEAAQLLRSTSRINMSREQLLEHMSFAPVEQTELLQISATARSGAEAKTLANTYSQAFVEHVKQAFVAEQVTTTVDIAELASIPTKPSKPKPSLYIGLGLIVALLIGVGVALLRDRLDQRLRIAETDETVLGAPIMARIPKMGERSRRHIAEDSFLLLKTNIGFYLHSAPRVVTITSGSPREGKTTMSVGLARAITRGEESAVLIEADLRRPTVAHGFRMEGAEPSEIGLSSYLVGAASAAEIVIKHEHIPGLSIVWSGPPAPSALPLLRSGLLTDLLDQLKREYDWVIVDTPPVLLGADASNIVAQANAAIFVIDAQSTTHKQASLALAQLRKIDPALLAVVLNRASTPDFSSYYGAPGGTRDSDAKDSQTRKPVPSGASPS
ncbi:MAG TPA: polysaccharide biosynthesis tyrosine autokinase [Solirubrobacteraceae bacterium]|nr:polysaccharide biosynthesis tyrosine autokinase [Solirubrobacteraceae bacterium]